MGRANSPLTTTDLDVIRNNAYNTLRTQFPVPATILAGHVVRLLTELDRVKAQAQLHTQALGQARVLGQELDRLLDLAQALDRDQVASLQAELELAYNDPTA